MLVPALADDAKPDTKAKPAAKAAAKPKPAKPVAKPKPDADAAAKAKAAKAKAKADAAAKAKAAADAKAKAAAAAKKKAVAAAKAKAKVTPLFPDKNLEAAVRKYVFEKKNNDKPLTADDVRNIATIEARGKKIKNLAGLEHCENVALIDLAANEITDLGPLQGLKKLQSLTLMKNKIKDIGPLANLTGLQYLHLAENQITDIKPLAKLTNLTALYLSKNQITDATPLGGLKKLWSLYLNGNKITDIKPLANLKNLSSLDLRANGITDISPLAGGTEYRYLFLDNNKITDVAVLVNMAAKDAAAQKRFAPFWRIYLTGNPLSAAARKNQLPALAGHGGRVTLAGKQIAAAPKVAAVDKAYLKRVAPGPGHKHLAQFVGVWKATGKYWPTPGATPQTFTAKSQKTMILGGRFLRENVKGTFLGQPYEGLGLLGYDNNKKGYTATWAETGNTSLIEFFGSADASGKVFVMNGQVYDPRGQRTRQEKTVLRVINANKHIFEAFLIGEDGKEFRTLEVVYERAQ